MIQIDGVRVALDRALHDPRKIVLVIEVQNPNKKSVWARNEVDPAQAGSVQATLAQVIASGGAAAEYLGEKYGAHVDPEKCAKLAGKCAAEELKLAAEAGKDVAAVVNRLWSMRHVFGAKERDRIDLWHWEVQRGGTITPADRMEMGEALAALHKAQL